MAHWRVMTSQHRLYQLMNTVTQIPTEPSVSYSSSVTSAKVDVNGVNLHYQLTGQGKHAILLFPGSMGCGETDFVPQLKYLNKELFTVVAFDPRGCGHSVPPKRDFPPDFLERDATDAVDLMQALSFKRFSLLGWSSGGMSALIAAAKYPGLIHKMVVWGAVSYVTEKDAKLIKTALDISNWSENARKAMEEIYDREYLVESHNALVERLFQFTSNPNGNILRHLLPDIRCPTLILHGQKDPVIQSSQPEFIHQQIKDSKLHVMPECKHHLHLEVPEEFNRLAEEFLT